MNIDIQPASQLRTAKVSKILTFSCVDGPGNRLVIFFQGCNFNCTSCHNPHSIAHCNHCGECVAECPDNALTLNAQNQVTWHADKCTGCDKCIDICSFQSSPKIREYSLNELLTIIKDNHLFLNGITVSGGEASLQLPFIISLFKAIKADPILQNLTCYMDSNGSLSEQGWNKILPYLDGAMIDLKAWDSSVHEVLVGRNNAAVFRTIDLLSSANKLHEIRLLTIPKQTDYVSNIDALTAYLNRLPNDVIIRLNAFQHHGVTGEALLWSTCSKEEIVAFKHLLQESIPHHIMMPPAFN